MNSLWPATESSTNEEPLIGSKRSVQRTLLKATLTILAFSLLATASVAQIGPSGSWVSREVKRTSISQRDRVFLNRALVNNKEQDPVSVLVACAFGQTDDVARQITALRGEILKRVDEIGYLRVRLALDNFETLFRLRAVVDATIDGAPNYQSILDTDANIFAWNSDPRRSIPNAYSVLPILPTDDLRAENPYIPTKDIGAPQFIRAHPTFDGRGTTIADVEVFPYWSHPVFQGALRSDGSNAPKFAGILSGADIDSKTDPTLVQMKVQVAASDDGYFQDGEGNTYRAPGPGKYRLGTFSSQTKQSYAVLWSQIQGLVWIDFNQNRNFADDEPLLDANRQFRVAFLPDARYIRTAIPGSPIAITTDTKHDAIHIYEKDHWHTTAVLSVMAGKGFFGGPANGVAPAAQLLPVDFGEDLHNVIESFIKAAENPAVDVITWSVSVRSFPNDGESFAGLMLSRIVAVYGKPVFDGTDNYGPGLASSKESSNSVRVASVGGYVGPDTMSVFTGRRFNGQQPLGLLASSGPSANGDLKPDFVVPVLTLFAYDCSGEEDNPYKSEAVKRFPYQLPPCYGAGEGTSFTGPIAAGAAALLISAAKQIHVPYSPQRLLWAMRTGARYLPGYPAYRQGAGLLQIDTSWKLLSSGVDPPEITASAPVQDAMSRFLKTPNQGNGLFERQGWTVGRNGQRVITLTRRSGPSVPQLYNVAWLGNDGTFQAQTSVQLPLDQPIPLLINVRPKSPGVHSAILSLVNPDGYAIHQTMTTIVVPDELNKENEFTSEHHATVGLESYRSYFIEVPENTSTLRVELKVLHGSVKLQWQDPGPLHRYERAGSFPYLTPLGGVHEAGNWCYLFAHPLPGTWEFRVENSDVDSGDEAEVQLRVTGLHVGVDLAESLESKPGSLPLPASARLNVRCTNLAGHLDGGIVRGEIGTIFESSSSVAVPGKQRLFEIHVPRGSTNLLTEIQVSPNQKGGLDLYLYDCSTGHCYLWDIAMFSGSRESILTRNPRPGLWKAVVSPEEYTEEKIEFLYRQVLTNPALGKLTWDGKSFEHRTGDQWTENLSLERSAGSVRNRKIAAWVEVVDQRAEAEAERTSSFEEGGPKGGLWNRPSNVGVGILVISK